MMAGDGCRQPLTGRQALSSSSHITTQPGGVHDPAPPTSEEYLDQAVETAVERAIFGGNELARRHFLRLIGASAATAIIRSAFPLETAKALAQEQVKDIEKKDLTVSFIPITCATPIIMAEPMGFYARHGLNVTVRRAAGWAVVRDWAINKEVDATHMLSPMPLSITLGAGSPAVPYLMPAVETINGQAITLHIKHKGVQGPQDMKGFRFCVPFDYSMHNYLLRYYLADAGLHPDKDVQIRVVPPPEMVANLKAGNVDGYLAPDPFNQRAVYENAGFIFKLSKELWDGHPCCAFAIFAGICQNLSQHLPGALQVYRRCHALCGQAGESQSHCRGDRAKELFEPAGSSGGAGAHWTVCRRVGQHQGGSGSYWLRSVPLALDGGVDSDADETLETDRRRSRL
jgi:nitrate/nitrite transport system substrate-binding protein